MTSITRERKLIFFLLIGLSIILFNKDCFFFRLFFFFQFFPLSQIKLPWQASFVSLKNRCDSKLESLAWLTGCPFVFTVPTTAKSWFQ